MSKSVCTSLVMLFVTPVVFSSMTMNVSSSDRTITSNGLPAQKLTTFPSQCDPIPAKEQHLTFTVPLVPTRLSTPYYYKVNPAQIFGVAVDGVVIEPFTAEYWSAHHNTPCIKHDDHQKNPWNYQAMSPLVDVGLDSSYGHVKPGGLYHYHGLPTALLASMKTPVSLIGYAADGYPIYANRGYQNPDDMKSTVVTLTSSYQLKKGKRPTGSDSPGGTYNGEFDSDYEYVKGAGDLDECNGRRGVTAEYPKGTYYYVITANYPYISRCFMAKPDASFQLDGPPPGDVPGHSGGPPERHGHDGDHPVSPLGAPLPPPKVSSSNEAS